jgi:hypothetical protein
MHATPTITATGISPRHAQVALAVFAAATLFFVAVTLSPLKSGFADASDRGPGDVGLYVAEVERMRDGQSYYDAVATELHERGYPTRSPFNWRTPLPVALIAALPELAMAKALLGLACLALVWLTFTYVADNASLGEGLFAAVLLLGALLPCMLGELLVMPELWSGVFIALSAVCLALDRRGWGVACGVVALFFRELAAPYVVVCVVLALADRRPRELAGWLLGLAAYGVFYANHLAHVLPRISADDAAHAGSWIRFGGAGFLISTAQMNAFLLIVPQWVTAVYLGLALVGATAWRTSAARPIGLSIAVYAIAFSVAGHDFNQYWGSMIAPLLCLGVCRAPLELRRWWRAARDGLATAQSVAGSSAA